MTNDTLKSCRSTGFAVATVLILGIVARAQEIRLDPTYSPTVTWPALSGPNFVLQPDGKIVAAGSFVAVNGTAFPGVTRLNRDGSVDPSFQPSVTLNANNATPSLVAAQPDGKIVLCREYYTGHGNANADVIRLNSDGSGDSSFTAFANFGGSPNIINELALGLDGKIILGGTFSPGVVRLNPDGTPDATFMPGQIYNGAIFVGGYPLALAAGGKLMVLSGFKGLVRLNPDGIPDSTFTASAQDGLYAIAVQADGKPILGVNGTVVRLNPNGSPDLSFNSGTGVAAGPLPLGGTLIQSIALQPDAKVIVSGAFGLARGVSRPGIARLNADGTLDASFNPIISGSSPLSVSISGIAIQPDGKVLISGAFMGVSGLASPGFARLNADGSLDQSFSAEFETAGTVTTAVAQNDGRLMIAGQFSQVNGIARGNLARLCSSGSVDASFAPPLLAGTNAAPIQSLQFQTDGNMVVAGNFRVGAPFAITNLMRLTPDGTIDLSFHPRADVLPATVNAVLLQPDGKLLVGGRSTNAAGLTTPNIVRLNIDGTLDPSFTGGIQFTGAVQALALQNDGRVVASGYVTDKNGNKLASVARLNQDGSLDPSFQPSGTWNNFAGITAALIQSDGAVVVGVGGNITRFHADGSVDKQTLLSIFGGSVLALATQPDGKLIASGNYTGCCPQPPPSSTLIVVRLNTDLTLDSSFTAITTTGFQNSVGGALLSSSAQALAIQPDGSFFVGGIFPNLGSQAHVSLARFQSGSAAIPPRLSVPTRAANGSVSFSVTGEPGRFYRVESSLDLRNWSPLSGVTNATSLQNVTDPVSGDFPQRFYRAVAP